MAYEKNTWIDNETPITAEKLNKMEKGIESNGLPIGSGMDYYGTSAPEDYMFADGSAISRTTYAKLFAIIGTTYGAGDGSTTFNLPDKRSRVAIMKDNGTFNTLGKKGGEEKHQLTKEELPKVQGAFRMAANIMTNISEAPLVYTAGLMSDNVMTNIESYATRPYISNNNVMGYVDNTHSNQINIEFGNNKEHNILQPYLVCNYIIKVK